MSRLHRKECFFCKRKGHFKRECEKYIAWKQKQEKANKVSHVKEEEHSSFALREHMCFTACSSSENMQNKGWIVDSGATSHMCNNRKFFEDLNYDQKGKVQFAGKEEFTDVEEIGFGKITVINNGKETVIKVTDVLYVPKLNSSLLSVTKLINKGFKVQFKDSICSVISPTDRKVKATAVLTDNKLFELQTKGSSVIKVKKIKEDRQDKDSGQLNHTAMRCKYPGIRTQVKKENKDVRKNRNFVDFEWIEANSNGKYDDVHLIQDEQQQEEYQVSGRETPSESASESDYLPDSYESFNDDDNQEDITVLRRSERQNNGVPPEVYMCVPKV